MKFQETGSFFDRKLQIEWEIGVKLWKPVEAGLVLNLRQVSLFIDRKVYLTIQSFQNRTKPWLCLQITTAVLGKVAY